MDRGQSVLMIFHSMKIHELKTDPEVFDAVILGLKGFEIRRDDRNFQVGDELFLRKTRYTGAQMKEGMPLEYTGENCVRRVGYVLHGPVYGLEAGWVIMSIVRRSAFDDWPREPKGRLICSPQKPFPLGNGSAYDLRWVHTNAKEIENSQKDGYPLGDSVEMQCPDCGLVWSAELPQ